MSSEKPNRKAVAEDLFNRAEKYEDRGDFRKAFKCLLAAAKMGDTGSQINLGNFYASGTGVTRSLREAAYWYKRAYRNGSSTGALNLAIDRRNSGNMRSAVVWFKKAIALHDGDACVELARIYNARRGGQTTAADLLRRALRLSRDHMSEAAREEAESLLKTIAPSAGPRPRSS